MASYANGTILYYNPKHPNPLLVFQAHTHAIAFLLYFWVEAEGNHITDISRFITIDVKGEASIWDLSK
jgi:hypothetical protein